MRLLERLRYSIFWSVDFLKGSVIRNHLNDINFQIGNSALPDKAIIVHQTRLRDLLKHATENCEFYSKYNGDIEISRFPVVNKYLIKENQAHFLAKNYRGKKLHQVITSGSTGTPFQTFHDTNKKQRNYADTLFYARIGGYKLGYRLIYMKIWVEKRMKSPLIYRIQNILPVDVVRFNDTEIEGLINRMEQDRSTFGILGYASAIESLCRFLDRKNSAPIRTNIKSVIAISESLNDYTREAMMKYFGAEAVSRYSNLENGIIAQQELNGSGRFIINTASYHIEVLKIETDEPASEGELGRIVVTDLFNYGLPMIRYDTGDIGALEYDENFNGRIYFSKIEGRKLDLLYDTEGNLVSSFLVYKNMWQYTEIDQYQLIQETKTQYTFKINLKSHFKGEKQLVEEFKSFLGRDADFRIEYVSEIPLLASGKRKKIVSRLTNPE